MLSIYYHQMCAKSYMNPTKLWSGKKGLLMDKVYFLMKEDDIYLERGWYLFKVKWKNVDDDCIPISEMQCFVLKISLAYRLN